MSKSDLTQTWIPVGKALAILVFVATLAWSAATMSNKIDYMSIQLDTVVRQTTINQERLDARVRYVENEVAALKARREQ
jgi:hypothetical protein